MKKLFVLVLILFIASCGSAIEEKCYEVRVVDGETEEIHEVDCEDIGENKKVNNELL